MNTEVELGELFVGAYWIIMAICFIGVIFCFVEWWVYDRKSSYTTFWEEVLFSSPGCVIIFTNAVIGFFLLAAFIGHKISN